MKKISIVFLVLFLGITANAQHTHRQEQSDTTKTLEEVTVTAKVKRKIETEMKMAVSVDEFLASSDNISFIKRGAYAWEPLLNNMSTERSTITIDGMHIFGACTDKMDPVTSYMESNSIDDIEIQSGQEGNMQGATIAGSIDLKRKKTAFSEYRLWELMYETRYESNNNQLFKLAKLSFSTNK